jgi:hypothetical protein
MIAGPEGGPSSDMQRSRAPHEIHYTFITAHFKKSDGRYIEHSFNIFPEILLERREVIHRPRLLSDNVLRAEGDRIGGQSFSVREHALAA